MKHAEKVEMLARLKRDVAHAEAERDQAREASNAAKEITYQEWQRGVATAWTGIRERLLSLQRYVLSLPIDDLDELTLAPAKRRAKKAPTKRKPAKK